MPLFRRLTLVALGLGLATGALADAAGDAAIKARKAHMQLNAYNLGALGAMAKGDVPYDAATAVAAAGNLVALSAMDESRYWLPDTDQMSAENTRALPALWENGADVMAKVTALNEAALAMQVAAGTDLAALQAAMGALGGACGACHKAYRAPE